MGNTKSSISYKEHQNKKSNSFQTKHIRFYEGKLGKENIQIPY